VAGGRPLLAAFPGVNGSWLANSEPAIVQVKNQFDDIFVYKRLKKGLTGRWAASHDVRVIVSVGQSACRKTINCR
jgi:hypothetical protein